MRTNNTTEKKLVTKTIRTSRIRIPADFANTLPSKEKLADKYGYYRNKARINRKYGRNNNIFQSPIIIDKHYVLVDGYITYLIAKMFGYKKVEVYIETF